MSGQDGALTSPAPKGAPVVLPRAVGSTDSDGAPVERAPIESFEGARRSLLIFERDETEAARATGLAVGHDSCLDHVTAERKGIFELLTRGSPAEAADK